MNVLELAGVHVRYGLVPALRGIDLAVGEGEMVALVGANGAGKTTTLRAISGLVRPHAGSITFAGRRIDGLQPQQVVGKGIAHMPEGRDLFPALSVQENLRFGFFPRMARDRGGYRAAIDQVYDAFPRLRERARQRAGTLSGGEQQMLTAGMALMSRPRLLLVDELSLGLAPRIVEQLFEVLRQVNQTGTAILLVEQFVPLALANTSRAYVLAKGEVVLARPSAELKDDPQLLSAYLGGQLGEEEPAALAEEVREVGHIGEPGEAVAPALR
jgi:branched-chain amino acid transport system ATP-binding protein